MTASGTVGAGSPARLARRPTGRRWRPSIGDAALVIPPVLLFALGWQRRWLADDGLIAARTVRQILAGNGPVFNPGQRVEANTSALWTWLIAGLAWVTRADVYSVLVWTGLILAPLGLLLALLGARRLHRRSGAVSVLPFGALVVLALPPFWDFVTSGLEESLIACWLGLCWYLLSGLRPEPSRRDYALYFTLGLGWVVRPETLLCTVGFLAAVLYTQRPGRRRCAGLLAVALAVPAGYQIFRMGYYGLLVPNTALAKEATSLRIPAGMAYLANFAGPYWLWVPGLTLAAGAAAALRWRRLGRPQRAVIVAAVTCGLLLAGYVIAIGGDFMHARMFLPAVYVLLLPVMAVPVPLPPLVTAWRRPPARAASAAAAYLVLAGWAVGCGLTMRAPTSTAARIINERQFWVDLTGERDPVSAARIAASVLGSSSDPGSYAALIDRASQSGRPVLIILDPGTGQRVMLTLNRPGAQVAASGLVLGSLGVAVQFWRNFADSFSLTGLRIPVSPEAAVTAFCHPGSTQITDQGTRLPIRARAAIQR